MPVTSRLARWIVAGCIILGIWQWYTIWYVRQLESQHPVSALWSAVQNAAFGSGDFGELALYDLSQKALRAGEMINVRMPYQHYWTAKLEPNDGLGMIVPVYKSHRDANQAWVYAPFAGTYNLSVHIPVPHDDAYPTDFDPPTCLSYSWLNPKKLPDWWSNLLSRAPRILDHMMDFCSGFGGTQGEDINGDDFTQPGFGGAFPPPRVKNLTASLVYQTTLHFGQARKNLDESQLTAELNEAAEKIYGIRASLLEPSPAEKLGYWYKDDVVTTEPGSFSFQPQPDTCHFSFSETGKTHQDACRNQSTDPTYRFTAFHKQRRQWLLPPNGIARCIDRLPKLSMYGDSKMWELWRASNCLFEGYAGLDPDVFRNKLSPHPLLLDPMPLFAPRDANLAFISDSEMDAILDLQENPEQGTVELWQIGMWPVSYVSSFEFSRGLHRLFSHVSKRRDSFGTKPYIVLVTSPNSMPTGEGYVPHWQTAERAYVWNQALSDVAQYYTIPVVDNFWPTIFRFDARVDNCHFCESMLTGHRKGYRLVLNVW